MITGLPKPSQLTALLFFILEFKVFFWDFYKNLEVKKHIPGILTSGCIYLFTFGITSRYSLMFVILIHLMLASLTAIQLFFEAKIQWYYALFCAFVFVLCRGVWNTQAFEFLFPHIHPPAGIITSVINNSFSFSILVIMKVYFVHIDKDRKMSGRELFSAIFPPTVIFFARIAIYHYAGQLNEETKAVFETVGLVLSLGTLVSLVAEESYFNFEKTKKELAFANEQLQRQYERFSDLKANNEKIKAIYHDMENHMTLLSQMSDIGAVKEYVQYVSEQTGIALNQVDTGNETLNLLLAQKAEVCAVRGICLEAAVSFPHGDILNPVELCTLFANPIDNAIEAVGHSSITEKTIRISGNEQHSCFVVRFENPYTGELNENLASSKEGLIHGYGLKNVRTVLENHDGTMNVYIKDNIFVLTMLIPLP